MKKEKRVACGFEPFEAALRDLLSLSTGEGDVTGRRKSFRDICPDCARVFAGQRASLIITPECSDARFYDGQDSVRSWTFKLGM